MSYAGQNHVEKNITVGDNIAIKCEYETGLAVAGRIDPNDSFGGKEKLLCPKRFAYLLWTTALTCSRE
jgi:hypothetical protein